MAKSSTDRINSPTTIATPVESEIMPDSNSNLAVATPSAAPAAPVTRFKPPANLPDFLADDPDFAADMAAQNEMMKQYVVVPRMKIIQSMASTELKSQFGEGSVILSPGNALVSRNDPNGKGCLPFDFTPVFFFVEYCKWKDLQDKSEGPIIVERSFDRNGTLARKAGDPNQRLEGYGPINARTRMNEYNYRFVEHLNFTGFIQGDHPLAGQLCALSFSKGEHSAGRNFTTAITMRKTPSWSQRWTLSSALRDRGTRKWWGIDARAAQPNNNITIDQKLEFRETHLQLKEAFETQRLQVDHSDADEDVDGKPQNTGGSGEF